MMDIGIAGWGVYTPETTIDAAGIAAASGIPEPVIREKFGVVQKAVPGPADSSSEMGIRAARDAINMAGISASEIDIVIWDGAQHKDYPCWLAGLKVAEEIGAVRAWSFDMEAMCGSMMVALETARSLMVANDRYNTVLLVSGYRNADLIDYGVAETSFMFDLGAGGAALILKKDFSRNRLLGTAFKGDGSFSELCTIKSGGTKRWPMKNADLNDYHFTIDNPDEFKRKLGETTLPNFFGVIDESLKYSGLTRADIDYLAILHFKKSTHDLVLKELELDENQSTYLNMYGHVGQNDQVISLVEGLAAGKIKNGDNLVMVGAGLGFVWASAVIKWGEKDEK